LLEGGTSSLPVRRRSITTNREGVEGEDLVELPGRLILRTKAMNWKKQERAGEKNTEVHKVRERADRHHMAKQLSSPTHPTLRQLQPYQPTSMIS
jgi:hypothetical protein